MASPLTLILLLIGLPLAFAGWKIYEGMIMLVGWAVGMASGYLTGLYLSEPYSVTEPGPGLPALFATIFSLIGIFTAYSAHRLVHAFTGFAGAALIGFLTMDSLAVALLLGLGGGYLTWMFHKISVIILSAVIGGILVSFGFGLQNTVPSQVMLVSIVALSGMAVQFGMFGTTEKRAADKDISGDGSECPSCGYVNFENDRYCYGCGAGLAVCDECRKLGLASWTYCDRCGADMKTG